MFPKKNLKKHFAFTLSILLTIQQQRIVPTKDLKQAVKNEILSDNEQFCSLIFISYTLPVFLHFKIGMYFLCGMSNLHPP